MNISYPLIIDGGLSNVLEQQGFDLNHKLWSAKLLATNPEAIMEAHTSYLEAGAQCIITSSYQASIKGFMEIGLDRPGAENLMLKSVAIAEKAVQNFMTSAIASSKLLIAASIGPYGAYLADGSEYRGNYGVSDEVLKTFHQEKIQLLDQTNVDFFACETIPSLQEAKVLSAILEQTQKSAWISFSCQDESHLNDGTPIEEAASIFANHSNVFALGINCTAPRFVSKSIKKIKAIAGQKKIVVYPNSGEVYDPETKTWSGLSDPIVFGKMANEWLSVGAEIIGGCCRIGPDHIRNTYKFMDK